MSATCYLFIQHLLNTVSANLYISLIYLATTKFLEKFVCFSHYKRLVWILNLHLELKLRVIALKTQLRATCVSYSGT